MKLFLAVCLSLLVVTLSCKQNPGRRPQREMARSFRVMTLTYDTITVHHDFPATVEGEEVIEIRPMINGYIQEIDVKEGDRVKKGQLLFRINNPMYEQEVNTARAAINKAVADVNESEMGVEKVKPLVEKQIVSDYRLKSAELTLESSRAELAQAKASLANAETNVNYTEIRSPHDGIIGTIPYKVGALVGTTMQTPLTTLSNIENVQAYFSWDEKMLLDFHSDTTGPTLEEKIAALPPATLIMANGKTYPIKGKVVLASGLISTETGAATLKAIFSNPEGLIMSGSSATIRIPETKDSVLIVPQSATYELQDKRLIYEVGQDNKVKAVAFSSIPTDNGRYFIVTHGLNPGEKVVIEGVNSLRDGNTIIPKEANADSIYKDIH